MDKKIKSFLLAFFIGLFLTTNSAYAYEQKSITIKLDNGKSKTVHYFSFKPDENVALLPVLAQDKVGKVEELSSMAKRYNAIAAINGTFFNAYDETDLMPQGTLVVNREMLHTAGSISMGISSQNELIFTHDYLFDMNLIDKYDHKYWIWTINRFQNAKNAIMIFNSYYKNSTLSYPDATFITVIDYKVTKIEKDQATIPQDGFIVALGPEAKLPIEINDPLYYEVNYLGTLKNALHIISNSPKLVTGGKYDIDFERDRVTDPKMTQQSAQRSFIGNKADGTIIMGTVGNVTLPELADILIQLGLQEAINLDGGASSGLYYNNKYITKPGRKLSNALVVISKPRTPRIEINGDEIFLKDASPYVESGTTMIPVRGVLEKLGAKVDWDQSKQQVIIQYEELEIIIPLHQKIVTVNGHDQEIPLPATSMNGRTYVPLRFLVETFGLDIQWNQERYTIEINTNDEI